MKVGFHSLRHGFASWLVNAGVELPTIAKVLCYKILEMTAMYSHVNDISVGSAMLTLDSNKSSLEKLVERQTSRGFDK